MRIFGVTAFLLVIASSGFGQSGGHVSLFDDPISQSCQITETLPGVLDVYVVHQMGAGAAALVFSVPIPDCASMTWLGDADGPGANFTIGISPTGVQVIYGSCLAPPLVALRITYFVTGEVAECCPIQLEESSLGLDPGLFVLLCDLESKAPVTTTSAYLNGSPQCSCTVSTENTSWGALKAMFANDNLMPN